MNQDRAASYWREGYAHDTHGDSNLPQAYLPSYVDLLERISYTAELVRQCRPVAPASALAVGCNAGRNLLVLQERFGLERVAGVDINEEAVERARRLPEAANWELHVRDAVADGLPDFGDGFDVVFTLASLVHMEPGEAKARLVREMWRLTGKRLVLIEAHADGKRGTMQRGVSDSPFWLDDYRAYVPELRELGPARGSADDTLDGLPIGRAGALLRPVRRALSTVNSRRGKPHPELYRILVADK